MMKMELEQVEWQCFGCLKLGGREAFDRPLRCRDCGSYEVHDPSVGSLVDDSPIDRGECSVTPQAGDVVIPLDDSLYYAFPAGGRCRVVEPMVWDHDGLSHVCAPGARMHRTELGGFSTSGGPFRFVKDSDLRFLGWDMARFWEWGPRGRGAGLGVDFSAPVAVWGWDVDTWDGEI